LTKKNESDYAQREKNKKEILLISSDSSKILRMCFEQLTHLGGIVFYCLLAAFMLVAGNVKIFTELVIILAALMGVAILIKSLYYKERPEKKKYETLFGRLDSSSFPSLHAMRISALAVVIGYYLQTPLVLIFLGLAAVLVIYSRIILKKHFIEDAIIGAIIGAGIALLVVLLFR
jgi:membrane-associated phospholipid phosphatase